MRVGSKKSLRELADSERFKIRELAGVLCRSRDAN